MTIIERVHHLRGKPRHIRERIVLAASFGITALVAIAWIATLSVSGAFSLAPTPAPTGALAQIVPAPQSGSNFDQLVGAVSAGFASATAPTLTVEDQGASSSLDRTAPSTDGPTVLTF